MTKKTASRPNGRKPAARRSRAPRRRTRKKQSGQIWRALNRLQAGLFKTRKNQRRQASAQKKAISKNRKAIRRIRWISIPGAAMGAAALLYLFYVVHVMERSMSSISADIHTMQGYMAGISEDTYYMSRDMGRMSRGVRTMSRAAQPMSAMRRMMPF